MVDDLVGAFFAMPPSQIAVLMIDFQNDFCSPEPFAGDALNTHNAATARRANDFARQAADLGAAVVYTQQVLDFDRLTPRQQQSMQARSSRSIAVTGRLVPSYACSSSRERQSG